MRQLWSRGGRDQRWVIRALCFLQHSPGVAIRTLDAWLTLDQIIELKKASEDKPEDKGEGKEDGEKARQPASTGTRV